eukprot:m51a1_g8108 hypothetical protein (314) ;mRNA; f:109941-110882
MVRVPLALQFLVVRLALFVCVRLDMGRLCPLSETELSLQLAATSLLVALSYLRSLPWALRGLAGCLAAVVLMPLPLRYSAPCLALAAASPALAIAASTAATHPAAPTGAAVAYALFWAWRFLCRAGDAPGDPEGPVFVSSVVVQAEEVRRAEHEMRLLRGDASALDEAPRAVLVRLSHALSRAEDEIAIRLRGAHAAPDEPELRLPCALARTESEATAPALALEPCGHRCPGSLESYDARCPVCSLPFFAASASASFARRESAGHAARTTRATTEAELRRCGLWARHKAAIAAMGPSLRDWTRARLSDADADH